MRKFGGDGIARPISCFRPLTIVKSASSNPKPPTSGFTLIELLVVIGKRHAKRLVTRDQWGQNDRSRAVVISGPLCRTSFDGVPRRRV